jgi:hypothetical protein
VPADKRAVKPLTDWCRRTGGCFYPLIEFLTNNGDAGTGKMLLALLDADPKHPEGCRIAGAVAKLQPEGAIPVLERYGRIYCQERRTETWSSWEPGLAPLAAFGKPGADALLRIFREADQMPCRLAAARLLAGARHEAAVEPVEKLLRETIEAGPGNPKLVRGNYDTADSAYVRTCQDLLESLDQLDHRRAAKLAEGVFLKGPAALRPGALKVLCRDEAAGGGGGPAQR